LELFLIIFAIATAPRLAYPFSEKLTHPSSENPPPENYLIVTTDRKVYSPGDTMKITIKNISENTLYFGGLYYSLVFERWDGSAWRHYESIRQQQVIAVLKPGQEGHVTKELRLGSGEDYAIGKYRVGTAGWFGPEGYESVTPPAYAEFEVREPRTWIVLTIVAIVIVGVIVTYLAIKRMRG
jgi:hypothetical protein